MKNCKDFKIGQRVKVVALNTKTAKDVTWEGVVKGHDPAVNKVVVKRDGYEGIYSVGATFVFPIEKNKPSGRKGGPTLDDQA